jgi:hypothetical protein
MGLLSLQGVQGAGLVLDQDMTQLQIVGQQVKGFHLVLAN